MNDKATEKLVGRTWQRSARQGAGTGARTYTSAPGALAVGPPAWLMLSRWAVTRKRGGVVDPGNRATRFADIPWPGTVIAWWVTW